MNQTIIGVDCATDERRTGLAYASWDGNQPEIHEVLVGGGGVPIAETIAGWLAGRKRALLALDAPLGWPIHLADTLPDHMAGKPISIPANALFRRLTDRMIKREIGRQPLDVGADRIARTALAALSLLEDVGQRLGQSIPLAWSPEDIYTPLAIEVYPAGTLTAYGFQASGYKGKGQEPTRRAMIEQLSGLLHLPEDRTLMIANDDALDAVICALAGADFFRGNTIQPTNMEVAKKEGWIWVRKV